MVAVVKRTPQEWLDLVKKINLEGPISLPQAAKLIKAKSKSGHVSVNTLMRWILNGCRGVFLEGCRTNGQQWSTSKQAIERFQAEQSSLGITRAIRRIKDARTPEASDDSPEAKKQRALDRLKGLRPKRQRV